MLPTNFGHTISRMGDVFDGYRRGPAWDEMIDETGSARAPYRALFDSIRNVGTQELRSGADARQRHHRGHLARQHPDPGLERGVGNKVGCARIADRLESVFVAADGGALPDALDPGRGIEPVVEGRDLRAPEGLEIVGRGTEDRPARRDEHERGVPW